MENKDIITNEVTKATEETIIKDSSKKLTFLGYMGAALVVCGVVYTIIKKRKDSKNIDEDIIDAEETNFKVVSSNEEE